MPAHTAVGVFTGTIYAISASLPATYDAAGYAATTITYSVIGGGVQDFPAYGSKRAVGKFNPINGAIQKYKGSPDYGSGNIVVADVPADAGQIILKAADASSAHYSVKITFTDSEVHYLDIIVAGWELSAAKENTPMLRTAMVEVCLAPVVVAAT
jgi:hypothetical protein